MLPLGVGHLEESDPEVRQQVLAVSAATINRDAVSDDSHRHRRFVKTAQPCLRSCRKICPSKRDFTGWPVS